MSFAKPSGPVADRSQRSVFVGNISYEVPEDSIRQIFSKVGPVLSIKMVFDRDTGKPKGYGFIEFPDVQTAELAIRNLNGYDLNGRALRVDSAAGGDRSADEIAQLQAALGAQQQVEESPYGPEPEDGKAPEAISRSVASLPPEKMFELMKQMKDVMRSNPNEAKQMLLTNPQLAYALLQAQVVMRIVDPQVAIAMLHRETPIQTQPFHQAQFAQPQAPPHFAHPAQPSGAMRMGAGPAPGMVMAPPANGGYRQPPGPPSKSGMSAEEEQNANLLVQVMKLSDEEIAMLPPNDREKIIELRNQLKRMQ